MANLLHNFTNNTPDQSTAIVAGAFLVIGVIIWLFGAHLVRLICVITALITGGIIGAIIGGGNIINHQYILPVIIVCAIVSGIMAWLFFRIWVALLGAAALAIIVPAASMVWQGTPVSDLQFPDRVPAQVATSQPTTQAQKSAIAINRHPHTAAAATAPTSQPENSSTAVVKYNGITVNIPLPESSPSKSKVNDNGSATKPTTPNDTIAKANSFYHRQKQTLVSWWSHNQNNNSSNSIYLSIAIAVTVGLMLGIAAPYVASSLESAIVGAILIFFCLVYLLNYLVPASSPYIPTAPRTVLFILAILSLLGFLFQWMLFHKTKDN